jgi:flagellar motility protein MotE (MotC chaperone)
MSIDSLQKMINEFKGPDLPKILAIMDPAKVAKLLEKMEPVKAAKLSKDIQSEASKIKAPA